MAEPRRLLISFSGGETSGYLAQWAMRSLAPAYDEVAVVFANTGQENEETLRFVEKCDRWFGLGVVWVETVVHHGKRVGCTHRVVDFVTASRHGEPFEEVIRKYGIPNKAYPHCTRDLKNQPITSYVRSLGWARGSYDTVLGIRADEVDRVSPTAKKRRLLYPLVADHPMTKPDINAWWEGQPFRLRLKGYEGNCRWCWKKSLRKHLTLVMEHPDWYEFPERMEQKYPTAGHNVDGTPRVFFREGRDTWDLIATAIGNEFIPAGDDARIYPDQELDAPGGGCTESCEAFIDDYEDEQDPDDFDLEFGT